MHRDEVGMKFGLDSQTLLAAILNKIVTNILFFDKDSRILFSQSSSTEVVIVSQITVRIVMKSILFSHPVNPSIASTDGRTTERIADILIIPIKSLLNESSGYTIEKEKVNQKKKNSGKSFKSCSRLQTTCTKWMMEF
jgi:hypothetical protein